MTDIRIDIEKLIKQKSIKMIKTSTNKKYVYDACNPYNNNQDQLFTDGMYYFHLNKYTYHAIKEISYDWGKTWENIRG